MPEELGLWVPPPDWHWFWGTEPLPCELVELGDDQSRINLNGVTLRVATCELEVTREVACSLYWQPSDAPARNYYGNQPFSCALLEKGNDYSRIELLEGRCRGDILLVATEDVVVCCD